MGWKKKTSFSRYLEVSTPLPVPQELAWALGLTVAQESPPPVNQSPDERLQVRLQLDPTREILGVDVMTLLTLLRPRGRTSKAGETWEGFGRHGKGQGEKGNDDDGFDASDDPLGRLEDSVDDEEVDQGVEEMLLEDLPRRRRQSPQV